MHRKGAVVIHELHEIGCRRIQRHFQRRVIESLHADFIEVCDFALQIRLGVNDGEQHVRVLITRHGVQRAVPAPHVIAGCDLLSVGPFGVGVEVEGNDPAFVAEFPTLGNAGFWLQRDRVFHCQAFEQRTNNVILRDARDHVGVEALGLGAVTVMQNAVAVARHHVTFTTATGGEYRQDYREY